jgi:glycerol-3-phosphate O-acyltransferase
MSEPIYDIITSYPKLASQLAKSPSDITQVIQNIDEIKGKFSARVTNFAVDLIDKTLAKLYDHVNFQYDEELNMQELAKKFHLVLVPNHQSHADYIALNYIWFKTFKIPVHVASGINLNIFMLGNFFRSTGAFFIRRSFQKDLIYKLTFEAYIYYLLKTDKIVEFFFEGGRSRTGKLLSPKFGLFQMLLEAHSYLEQAKPLMFLPISIAHEHLPEEAAHARELSGGEKKPENFWQILKIFKLLLKKLGNIHIRIGKGVVVSKTHNIKQDSQDLAFQCFFAVGEGMPVSAISLVSMILLDEHSGAQTWEGIVRKSRDIIHYSQKFKIPLVAALESDESCIMELQRALDMLIQNDKIETHESKKLGQTFYSIKNEARVNLLYFKNMIIHHYLVPSMMNSAWFNIFNGNLKTTSELYHFLLEKRKELRFEFYLPSPKAMLREALDIVTFALGRKVESLEEAFSLSVQELYLIASKVRIFSTALSYLYESYFLSSSALKHLRKSSFSEKDFLEVAKELHTMELLHGRLVKYPESYLVPVLKDSLKYFLHDQVLKINDRGLYELAHTDSMDKYIEKFAKDINDQVVLNLKLNADAT